jgi:glucose-6-phosphate isomerase
MANIVSTAFESEYGDYEIRHGAAYYVMSDGDLMKNPHYHSLPPVRRMSARSGRGKHRFWTGPLYSLLGNEEALAFLNHPEDYRAIFAVLLKD